MNTPLVSIVSLTWNSQRFIEPFLSSLLEDADTSGLKIEVLVVDNGSQDGTTTQLDDWAARRPELDITKLSSNEGTTVARNLALRKSRGEYVLVLDSDMVIASGTLKALVESHQDIGRSGKVGMVCPRLTYPNGDFQESARRFPTVATKVLRLLRADALRQRDESIADVLALKRCQVDYAISAAWFFHRSILDEVGYLDERIFYAPEDAEYCARLWSQGYPVWFEPSVTIVHDCQRLTNRRPLSKLGLRHLSGLIHYWTKYNLFLFRNVRKG